MPERKVTIDIETRLKGEGAQTAQKKLDALGKSTKQTASLAADLSQSLGGLGPAAGKAGGAMRAFGSILSGVSGGVAGLATVLIGAGISAWAAWQRKVAEAQKAIDDWNASLTKAHNEAASAKLDQSIAAHERLRGALSEEHQALQRLSNAYASVDNAQKAAALAALDLSEKEALAQVRGPDSELQKARLSATYASRRRDLHTQYDIKDFERRESAATAKIDTAELQKASHRDEISHNTAAIDQLTRKLHELKKAAPAFPLMEKDYSFSSFWSMGWDFKLDDKIVDEKAHKATLDEITEQTKAIREELARRRQLLEAGNAAIAKADNELLALRAERSAVQVGIESYRHLRPRETSLAEHQEQSAISSAQWGQRLSDLRSRASGAASTLGARATATRAAADAFEPTRAQFPRQTDYNRAHIHDRQLESTARGAERLSASAQKLEQQLKDMQPERLATAFDSITRQLATLERAIQNAEARSKRQ